MEKISYLSVLLFVMFCGRAQTTNVFTVTNNSGTSVLTCSLTQIDLTVNTTVTPPWSFHWSGPATSVTGTHVTLSQPGTYTVTMLDSLNAPVGSQSITITSNTSAPSVFISPLVQNITCTLSSITNVTAAVTPTTNITQYFTSPLGGILSASSFTTLYTALSPGIYTHCAVDNLNGCTTCNTFTVTSNQAFPTFSLSSTNGFSLGCASKSVESIFFNNAQGSGGGASSFTLFPPGSSFIFPPNPSPVTAYTLTAPGIYTAAICDLSTGCIAATPFNILTNTISPSLSISANNHTITCASPQVTLSALSTDTNVSYLWTYAPNPSAYTLSSVVITSASPVSNPTVGLYSVTITNNNNLCVNTQSILVYRNTYNPNAVVNSSLGLTGLTCKIPTLALMNQSTSGIPGSQFPNVLPVVVQQWAGPFTSPGSPTYLAGVPGTYTMTVIDPNNGCTKDAFFTVLDNRIYPGLSTDENVVLLPCPGSATLIVYPMSDPTNNTYTWTAPVNATVSSINSTTLIVTTPGTYTLTAENVQNGCKNMISIDVWSCVGLEKTQTDEIFKIYPNPAQDFLNIEMSGSNAAVEMIIINSLGQTIKKEKLSCTTVDLNDIAAGIYFLELRTIQYSRSFKLVKN